MLNREQLYKVRHLFAAGDIVATDENSYRIINEAIIKLVNEIERLKTNPDENRVIASKNKEQIHAEIVARITSELCLEAEVLAERLLALKNPQALIYIQINKVIAKTQDDIPDNTDRGDILYSPTANTSEHEIIEVKRLSSKNKYAYFQTGTDFYNGVLIDAVNQIQKKPKIPLMYITFNYPLTHFFTSYPKKEIDDGEGVKLMIDTWEKRMIKYENGIEKLCYFAKTVDCKFWEVKEYEKMYNEIK